jgi:hypothetical protein
MSNQHESLFNYIINEDRRKVERRKQSAYQMPVNKWIIGSLVLNLVLITAIAAGV